MFKLIIGDAINFYPDLVDDNFDTIQHCKYYIKIYIYYKLNVPLSKLTADCQNVFVGTYLL